MVRPFVHGRALIVLLLTAMAAPRFLLSKPSGVDAMKANSEDAERVMIIHTPLPIIVKRSVAVRS